MAETADNNTTAATGETTQPSAEYIKIKVVGQVCSLLLITKI